MAYCDTYDPGECTRGACQLAPWVGQYWGDGGDWARRAAAAGFALTMTPTVGSVVCYGRGDGYSEFGHVAYVEDTYDDGTFLVREMNFTAWDVYDERRSTTYDVVAFILPPGVQPGASPPSGGRGGSGPQGGGFDAASAAFSQWGDFMGHSLPQLRDYLGSIGAAIDQT